MLAAFLNRPFHPNHRRPVLVLIVSLPSIVLAPPAHPVHSCPLSSRSRSQLFHSSISPVPPSHITPQSLDSITTANPLLNLVTFPWLPLATTSRTSRIIKLASITFPSKSKTSIVTTQRRSSFPVSFPRDPLVNSVISKTIVGISSKDIKGKNQP